LIKKMILLLLFPIFYGCGEKDAAIDAIERTEYFSESEKIKIESFSKYAIDIYREDGLSGGIGLVKDCYEKNRRKNVECVIYDLTLLTIDREVSNVNNWKRDEFFHDNQFLSRATGVSYFSDEGMGEIMITIGKMVRLVNSVLEESSESERTDESSITKDSV
jgi:hypothetical protein